MDLWDRIREKLGFKESAVTGLNWGRNVLKLVAVVVVPFYLIWGLSQVSYYVWELDELVVTMQLAIGLSFWGSGIYGYMAHVKSQAASMLSFPASKWRFSETQVAAIDLVLPEGSIEYIGRLERKNDSDSPEDKATEEPIEEPIEEINGDNLGHYVYRLTFPFLIGYAHPTRGMLGFNRCYWLIPAEWEKQFHFRSGGEIWYGGFPISHPKAEDVSLHVYPYERWEINKRELLPVCLVHDSKLHYQATMNKLPERLAQQLGRKPEPKDIQRAKESALIKENIELQREAFVIGEELEAKLTESFSIKKVRKQMLADHKRRYGHVLRAEEPWRWKLLNLRFLGFVALIVIAAVVVYSFYLAPLMGGLILPVGEKLYHSKRKRAEERRESSPLGVSSDKKTMKKSVRIILQILIGICIVFWLSITWIYETPIIFTLGALLCLGLTEADILLYNLEER